ncbi:tnf receptor [Skunkpox virus]|uniref:Tnf receptor n=1 Tax=Skunkpox virus TaxID=160796 RepID=A0A1C9KBJ0_9POXV|nr:tnf receptor [Skunkpox virus]AOP31486.1 tnf receptor [Skunkpox virus]
MLYSVKLKIINREFIFCNSVYISMMKTVAIILILSLASVNSYSHDIIGPYITNTFNYISVDIEMSIVNATSCVAQSKETSNIISTSDLTITLNTTDCAPTFVTSYYSAKDGTAIAGFFTDIDKYQNNNTQCKLSLEIKCNSETEPRINVPLIHIPDKPRLHSETFNVVGDCLANIDVYIMYVYMNGEEFEQEIASIHVGYGIDTSSIIPQSCGSV